jgi:hypothetical protein
MKRHSFEEFKKKVEAMRAKHQQAIKRDKHSHKPEGSHTN